jgi:hypothetical protein
MGMLAGGVNPFALPLLICGWAIYAMFLAGLGMWFSLVSRTTLRATIWTLIATTAVSVGPWIVFGALDLLSPGSARIGEAALVAFCPPATLWELALYHGDFEPGASNGTFVAWEQLGLAMFGLAVYGAAAGVLWQLLHARFAQVTKRMPLSTTR